MDRLAARHPGYYWDTNKGYATPEHLDALARLGPTHHHRYSFAPVSQLDLLAAAPAAAAPQSLQELA
jgi:ribonuclease HII